MENKRKEYIKQQFAKLDAFVDDVLNERFPVCNSIIKAVQRYQSDITSDQYELRKDKLIHFFKFLSYTKINVANKYVTFSPEGYQVFYFANKYGLYHTGTNTRKYTTSFLTIARKCGKTTIAAIEALYGLTSDGQLDGQVYFVSGSKNMAGIGLDYCKNVVNNSPALKKRVDALQYSLRYQTKEANNFLKALPAVSDRINGTKPSSAVLDELHIMKDSSLLNIIRTGQASITNPMLSIITTRGFNTTFYQYTYEQYLKRVLDGEVTDDSTFIMIFELDHEDEIKDKTKWCKAVPNLLNPKILSLDQLENIYSQSLSSISDLRSFIVLNLNYWWTTADDSFVANDVLDGVFIESIDDDLIDGESCFMGCDLSSNKDISSISLVFPPSDRHDEYIIKNYNLKTNIVSNRVTKNGIDLTFAIESGDLIELDTPMIDYEYLFNLISELHEKYDIQGLGFDRYNAAILINKVHNELGMVVKDVPQTAMHLNQPLKYLEKLMIEQKVQLNNAVTKIHFKNLNIYTDSNGNIKPLKNKSKDSIDSVMAICNAMAMYIAATGERLLNYSGVSI